MISKNVALKYSGNYYFSDFSEGSLVLHLLERKKSKLDVKSFFVNLRYKGLDDNVLESTFRNFLEFRTYHVGDNLYTLSEKEWKTIFGRGLAISNALKTKLNYSARKIISSISFKDIVFSGSLYKCFNCYEGDLSDDDVVQIFRIAKKMNSSGVTIVPKVHPLCDSCKVLPQEKLIAKKELVPEISVSRVNPPSLSEPMENLFYRIVEKNERNCFGGVLFHEFKPKKIAEYEKLLELFSLYLEKNNVKETKIYCDLINDFLLISLNLQKTLETIDEQILLELVFERFIRKSTLDQKHKSHLRDAIIIFYSFIRENKPLGVLVPPEVLEFTSSCLREETELFKKQLEINPVGTFYADNKEYHDNYLELLREKVLGSFPIITQDIDHQGYAGAFESTLIYFLEKEFVLHRRSLFQSGILKREELEKELISFQKKWIETKREIFEGYSFIDLLLLERKKTEIQFQKPNEVRRFDQNKATIF